jgi:3-oxoacyl-[acyl-carrier-protein] synthase II
MSVFSPLGLDLAKTLALIKKGQCAVKVVPEWDEYKGLRTRLAARLPEFDFPENYTLKATRCMGRAARLATYTSELALRQANLLDDSFQLHPSVQDGSCGIAYGSGISSTDALENVCNFLYNKATRGINGTTYLRMMSHTSPANIGIFFGINGRVIPTSSACTSGSLAIGYAYETIREGKQKLMIAGGSEEFSPAIAAIFDVLFACSLKKENSPRPFDKDRDGMVVGEGACTFILEDMDHALARGANIIAEIIGFGTNSDGCHVTSPNLETVRKCMSDAMKDAGISPSELAYINAHATGTIVGDIVESEATYDLFSNEVPVSSLKGHLAHLLGASGAVEAAATIGMLKQGWLAPTLHLEQVDERCKQLDYIQSVRECSGNIAMSNTFAFGGVNTSLIFKL